MRVSAIAAVEQGGSSIRRAAVEQGGSSIRRAAVEYGIPRSTLHDHISGKVEHGAKPGRDPYLSLEEEEELVSFLLKCARIGCPRTLKQVMALAREIVTPVSSVRHSSLRFGGYIK